MSPGNALSLGVPSPSLTIRPVSPSTPASPAPSDAPSPDAASPDAPAAVDAVLFDLLTALLDSWTVWNRAAKSDEDGRRWRHRYLELTYAAGNYRPYEALVHESARSAGLGNDAAARLLASWDTLEAWPEVPSVLAALAPTVRLGVVTNCSNALAARAVARLGHPVDVWVAAERAGAYKPDARPYALALADLGLPASRVLFVAGSPFDIPGAGGVGMRVVWHNRLQLARPAGVGLPWRETATLDTLPALVRRVG